MKKNRSVSSITCCPKSAWSRRWKTVALRPTWRAKPLYRLSNRRWTCILAGWYPRRWLKRRENRQTPMRMSQSSIARPVCPPSAVRLKSTNPQWPSCTNETAQLKPMRIQSKPTLWPSNRCRVVASWQEVREPHLETIWLNRSALLKRYHEGIPPKWVTMRAMSLIGCACKWWTSKCMGASRRATADMSLVIVGRHNLSIIMVSAEIVSLTAS